ncbi:Stomatin-like protein 2 mitochondrial [Bienertia sinuspersici]
MSITRLARTQTLNSSMNSLTAVSRNLFSSSLQNALLGSLNSIDRTISTSSSSPIFNQSHSANAISPRFASSRNFSTSRHFDPYERYMRRTAMNWGINFVPQQEAYVIERFGKFSTVLEAGLHLLLPFIDRIAYIHSLKEQTIEIPEQPAVTTDNVSIRVNGVLFVKVIDAEKASYGNDNVMFAVTQLAQTVMRSAIGKMPLDKTFMERDTLNANIVDSINDVASQWGLVCRRYEIRDIIPPPGIRESMEMQAEAERKKRAEIIEAEGEAEAIRIVSEALHRDGGQAAAGLKLAHDYVQAFNNMAKESTTMLLPSSVGDASSMVASALALYKNTILKTEANNKLYEGSKNASSARQLVNEDDGEVSASEDQTKPVFSLQNSINRE